MKRLIFTVFSVFFYTHTMPPEGLRGPALVQVNFVDNVFAVCAALGAPLNSGACYDSSTKIVYADNPCKREYEREVLAQALCHEKGHFLDKGGIFKSH